MKTSDWLVLGGLALGGYFLWKYLQNNGNPFGSTDGGITNWFNPPQGPGDIGNAPLSYDKRTFIDLQNVTPFVPVQLPATITNSIRSVNQTVTGPVYATYAQTVGTQSLAQAGSYMKASKLSPTLANAKEVASMSPALQAVFSVDPRKTIFRGLK